MEGFGFMIPIAGHSFQTRTPVGSEIASSEIDVSPFPMSLLYYRSRWAIPPVDQLGDDPQAATNSTPGLLGDLLSSELLLLAWMGESL